MVAASAPAAITFGFETLDATSGISFTPFWPGSLTSVSETIDGLTVEVTRLDEDGNEGVPFDIHDFVGWSPAPDSWGNRALSPFNDVVLSAFVLRFSELITSFSVEFGDYGADDDTATIEAFDDDGNFVNSDSVNYGLQNIEFDEVGTLSVFSKTPIRTVYLNGTSGAGNNSLYWDNVTVEVVPEPATLAALGLGVLALRRRRK